MKLKRFTEFILEKVYLFSTNLDDYAFLVDPKSKVGTFKLDVKGGYGKMEMEVQIYGEPQDKQLIFRIPSQLQNREVEEDMFSALIKDILHILNKNRLGYEFKLNKITKERYGLNMYAIVDANKSISIKDLERLAQTTKIVNAKVKDIDDFDKLVYYTND